MAGLTQGGDETRGQTCVVVVEIKARRHRHVVTVPALAVRSTRLAGSRAFRRSAQHLTLNDVAGIVLF